MMVWIELIQIWPRGEGGGEDSVRPLHVGVWPRQPGQPGGGHAARADARRLGRGVRSDTNPMNFLGGDAMLHTPLAPGSARDVRSRPRAEPGANGVGGEHDPARVFHGIRLRGVSEAR